ATGWRPSFWGLRAAGWSRLSGHATATRWPISWRCCAPVDVSARPAYLRTDGMTRPAHGNRHGRNPSPAAPAQEGRLPGLQEAGGRDLPAVLLEALPAGRSRALARRPLRAAHRGGAGRGRYRGAGPAAGGQRKLI